MNPFHHTSLWHAGFEFASGAATAVAILYLGFALIVWALSHFTPTDDTDGGRDDRSGMQVLTDHGTGCQYLYRSGAIFPRLNSNGDQVCKEASK